MNVATGAASGATSCTSVSSGRLSSNACATESRSVSVADPHDWQAPSSRTYATPSATLELDFEAMSRSFDDA